MLTAKLYEPFMKLLRTPHTLKQDLHARAISLSSGLLKMTDFSCGLILPKISQQPARQPVAGRLRIPAQNEAHLGAPRGDST